MSSNAVLRPRPKLFLYHCLILLLRKTKRRPDIAVISIFLHPVLIIRNRVAQRVQSLPFPEIHDTELLYPGPQRFEEFCRSAFQEGLLCGPIRVHNVEEASSDRFDKVQRKAA